MEQIREDLWCTGLRDEGGVSLAGFLLLRPEGNVQLYAAPTDAAFNQIAALGGIDHQVLSHRHEVDPSPDTLKKRFGTRLCADAAEGVEVGAQCEVDVTFGTEDTSLGSLRVLHTPGHTKGGVTCVYSSPYGERYLFSGDTMIPVKSRWIAQIVPGHGGDAAVLTRSLLRLRDLAPDLVLSSAAIGEHRGVPVDRDEWVRAVDETAGRPPIGSSQGEGRVTT